MTTPRFFRDDAVQRLFQRAARAAATMLQLHYVGSGDSESPCILAFGECALDAYLETIPAARAELRRHRLEASQLAIRHRIPSSFLDPVRLMRVSAAVASDGAMCGYVVTFGPFCPSEASPSLEPDVLDCLATLGVDPKAEPPPPLDQVPIMPASAVYAVAEWCAADARALAAQSEQPNTATGSPPAQPSGITAPMRGSKGHTRVTDPYHGSAIAAALAAGDTSSARQLVETALLEDNAPRKRLWPVRRARLMAIVSAALEGSEQAGLPVPFGWERVSASMDTAQQGRSVKALVDAAMDVLRPIAQRQQAGASSAVEMRRLRRLLQEEMANGITLEEAAAALRVHPTAVTHHLQRKFGLSFSQYLGRLRIDKAKQLLRRTSLNIRDIACRVGIDDTSNFNRLFKKFETISPSEYRNRYGAKP